MSKDVLVVYGKHSHRYSSDYTDCICANLKKVGCSVDFIRWTRPLPKNKYDLVVMTSYHPRCMQDLKRIKVSSSNIVYFAAGGFNRTQNVEKDNTGRIQYLTSFNEQVYDGTFIYEDTIPADRWNKLKLKVKPWRKGGDCILIAHQHFDLYGIDRTSKFKRIINRYKKRKYKMRIRLHPRVGKFIHKDVKVQYNNSGKMMYMGVPTYKGKNIPIKDDLDNNVKCVVTYDSSIVVESLIEGIPIIVYGKHITDPVQSKTVKDLKYPDRQPWFNWLAYQHWNRRELCGQNWFNYYRRIGLLKF